MRFSHLKYVFLFLVFVTYSQQRCLADTEEVFNYTCLDHLHHLYKDDKESDKFVALTFDDGPSKVFTPQILKVLNKKGVKATFFEVGENIKHFPNIVLSLKNNGEEIENHSYSHPDLPKLSPAAIENQLQKTKAELAKLGITPHWFRPPYGAYDKIVDQDAFKLGMKVILWSLDTHDWQHPSPSHLEQYILKNIHPGDVILLHDIHATALKALPDIIDELKAKGYHFVTLNEWYNKFKALYPSHLFLCSK